MLTFTEGNEEINASMEDFIINKKLKNEPTNRKRF